MENIAQKSKQFLLRSLLLIATVCLVLIVILQIALIVAVNALNTGKAHGFIQSQVTSSMAESGYNATFDKLFYDPVRGFTLYNLTVLDKEGAIVAADKLSLDIAFSKIPLRRLELIISAGKVNLIRLPESQPDQEVASNATPFEPFELPNIYFKTFKIFRLNIDSLNIGASIAGQDLAFSPTLKATVRMRNSLSFDASLLPKPSTKIGDISFPEKIAIAGSFTPATLSFALKELAIISPDYEVAGKGEGQLTTDGTINVNIDAQYPDLKILTQDNIESANLSVAVDGTYNHPALRMDGKIVPASLKEKGLDDIILSVSANDIVENLKGNIGVQTSYLKEPITLDVALSYGADSLKIESLKGTAPLMTLNGSGELSTVSNLFDGALSVSASDLSYYKDLLSQDIAGAFKADIFLKPDNAAQSLDVTASATQLKFDTTRLGKADMDLHFTNLNHMWPQAANIQISALSVSDTVSLDKAQLDVKDAGQESYNLFLTGNGHIPSAVSFKGNLNLSNLTHDFPTIRDIDFTTMLGKSMIALSGAVDENAVDLKVSTKDFRGSDIPAELPATLANLRLNADISMTGTPAAPSTKAHIVASGMDTGQYKNLAITVDANHLNGQVGLTVSGKGSGLKTLQAKAAFPLSFALSPFAFDMDMNAPLSGDLLADIDFGAISPLFLPPTQEFSAGVKANASIGGTLSDPDVKGALNIRNGEFTDEQNGITLRAINMGSSFTKNSVVIDNLSATDGEKGKMDGKGHLEFAEGGSTKFALSMKNFHLPASNLADGMLDATFSLVNTDAGYALNGAVDIDQMNILVPETFQSKIPELNIVERKKSDAPDSASQQILLGIKANAPNQIFVRGWGLDAEFGGELDISGDIMAPLFNGSLSSKRGRYEEFGKRFTLARANLRFQGEMPPSPYLDIEATVPADDVTASIILAGPVKEPSISFSSTPALPRDEVLSRLLFGRDTTKITPFQAVQLAQTLRRFSGEGGGGIDPLGMIRSATGLDDISIDTDANGDTNVGVGKYLTDKVYLEFEKGKAPGSGGANIQIELTPSINIQSEVGQDAQAGGGIFWKKDY